MRRTVIRAALWGMLLAACPAVAVLTMIRPALSSGAAWSAAVIVPSSAVALVRARGPLHRRPGRHERVVDMEARRRLASVIERVDAHDQFWAIAHPARETPARRDLRLVRDDDRDFEDTDPGRTRAGLACLPVVRSLNA